MLVDEVMLFIALLFIGGMFINGIHITTRGETVIAPDGTKKDKNDMIFYPLLKFIMQEKKRLRIYYNGERLKEIWRKLNTIHIKILPENTQLYLHEKDFLLQIYFHPDYWGSKFHEVAEGDFINTMAEELKRDIENRLGNNIKVAAWFEKGEHLKLRFYEDKIVYRFSKYIRKPTLQCLKCMASFWGTLIFWSSYPWIVGGFQLIHIGIWVAYCFCLTWVNMWLYNKSK